MQKELLTLPLSELTPYANNPRFNSDAVDAVAESIKQCGYVAPILIDEDNVILAGHTRLKALQRLKKKETEVMRVTGLTEEQKKKYRLLDNKTAEIADWDFEKLDAELEGLDFWDYDFGFDTDDSFESGKGEYSENHKDLKEMFLVPPFTILNSRAGDWQERKRKWLDIIGDDGSSRGAAQAFDSSITKIENFNMKNVSIFDPVLAETIALWFLPQGQTCNVFDTFAGDTGFGFVAAYKGHKFTGVELRQEQAAFNQEQVDRYGLPAAYHCDDGRNIRKYVKDETQDLFFSCPPYYDLEVYSDLENDASNQGTYEDFYKILDEAFSEAIKCLKNNRFAVVVASDVRGKDGGYHDFISDIKRTFLKGGCKIYNELVLVNAVGTAAVRAERYMRSRKVVRTHQEVLIFYKGDPKKIRDEFGEAEVASTDESSDV